MDQTAYLRLGQPAPAACCALCSDRPSCMPRAVPPSARGTASSGADLNLHEPGAVRTLLDVALPRGWQSGQRQAVEVGDCPGRGGRRASRGR